jgi:hypothetical protein
LFYRPSRVGSEVFLFGDKPLKTYKFFGAACEHTGHELSRLGQEIKLPEEEAFDSARGGNSILPADVFDTIFDADDVKKYPTPVAQHRAPEAFHFKLDKARQLRLEWLAGTPRVEDHTPADQSATSEEHD